MEQKTVLITGGSRGIGAACVTLFAQKGWNVAFTYNKNEPLANELVTNLLPFDGTRLALRCDVSSYKDVRHLFMQVYDRFKTVDVLVNNAGIALEKLFVDMTEADWDHVFAVNAKGVFNCCQLAVPQMIDRMQGKIINISSMWGQTGASCETAYSASKAAVIGLTKALAKELGPSGICVNCIAPGVIATDMNAHLSSATLDALKEETPLCCLGTAEDIAEAVWFLAISGRFITGQVLGVNGGFVI